MGDPRAEHVQVGDPRAEHDQVDDPPAPSVADRQTAVRGSGIMWLWPMWSRCRSGRRFWRWLFAALLLIVVTVALFARFWPDMQPWAVSFAVPVFYLLRLLAARRRKRHSDVNDQPID